MTPPPVRCIKRRSAKKSSAPVEGLGRSRGGFSTKLHAVVDSLDNYLHLDPDQTADCGLLPDLLAALLHSPGAVVANRDYDMDKSLQAIAYLGAEAVIPPKVGRLHPRPYDGNLYIDRSKVQRFFGRLKEARALATRYDKTACSFLAVTHLLVALDWLR